MNKHKSISHPAQEILRVHPTVTENRRVVIEDHFLPLAKPVVGISGKVYDELPVPAGTITAISLTGYNLYVRFLGSHTCGDRRVEANFISLEGTRTYGGQTLMNSDRKDGSRRGKNLNFPLGSTATCA
jgi:hypothetical protein